MRVKLIFTVGIIFALLLSLIGSATTVAAQPPEMVKVFIAFDRQPGANEEAIVHGAGGNIKYTYHLVPAIAASVPAAAIQGLSRNPRITTIESIIRVYAVDAELDNTWGVKRIGAGIVHDAGNKGAGVKIAVIDSGIDYTHSDLDANYAGGYDFFNSDSDPMDDNGHGTHVAGTIAAEDNGTGVVGVAPAVKIYALKVLGADGSGYFDDVIAAVQWCVANGIQITNNSYGSSGDPGSTVRAAFDNAEANGIVNVAAAGNSGNPRGTGNSVIYPARWESVIAVAATDSSDNRARWSSTGDTVELAVPGVSINSTLRGGGYGTMSGTSMASPHVAGTAALVIATGISDTSGNGRINDEVRTRLQQTADDLGTTGKDPLYGYGLVDADGAAPAPIASGAIQGTVTDGTYPITGASVTDGTRTATTDSTGNYKITGVPDGTYTVTAAASGYHSTSHQATVSCGGTTTLNFTLTKILNGAISGKIFDADTGLPIVGATVTDGTRTATTNTSGDYTLSDVPPGTYTVIASASGYQSLSQSVNVQEGLTSTANFALNPASQATAVSVSSISYYTEGGKDGKMHLRIVVALVDDLGSPVGGASVSISVNLNGSRYTSGTGTTGTDGKVTFKLNAAPSGTYTTTVTGVSATGLIWDGTTPLNSYTK